MKKVRLLVSICVAATLSVVIGYEFSKSQDSNKTEIVESKNKENSIDKSTDKDLDKKEGLDKKEESDKNEEKTSVNNTSDNSKVNEGKAIEVVKKVESEQSEIDKNSSVKNQMNEINTDCESGIIKLPERVEVNDKVQTPDIIEKPTQVEKPSYSESDSYIAEIEQAIFTRVNAERASNGLAPLSYNNTMQKYARIKSKDMGDRGYFDHKNPEGELITSQMKRDGVTYSAWGENIAYIQGNSNNASLANQFMNNWMNSQGHRENILSSNFTSIGIGVYKVGNTYYATQEFYR